MAFEAGEFVGVRCDVHAGPFDEERLVTIDTIDGAISGFVSVDELRQVGDRWEVRGKVRSVRFDVIEVWIFGSFFTTNGIASIRSDQAIAA